MKKYDRRKHKKVRPKRPEIKRYSTLNKSRFFDILSLIFLCLHLLFLLLNWSNYPTELDTPYHLLMGKMFADHNRLETWDSYEFAPDGRPHLYSPGLHILIWWIHKISALDYMDIGRLLVIIQAFLTIFFLWSIGRKFFNPAVAFYALIFFSSCTESWWWQTSVVPSSLVVMWSLPFIYLLYQKRWWPCLIILTTSLYLHYGITYLLFLIVLLFPILSASARKEYIRAIGAISAGSLLLFTPWLVHMWKFRYYFTHHATSTGGLPLISSKIVSDEIILNLNNLLWLFALIGVAHCLMHRKKDPKLALLLSSFVSFLIFLFLFRGVRFNSHSPIVNSLLAGVGLSLTVDWLVRFFKKRGLRGVRTLSYSFLTLILAVTILFELHLIPPSHLKRAKYHGKLMGLSNNDLYLRPTPLVNEIRAVVQKTSLKGKHRIRIQDFFTSPSTVALIDYLKKEVDPRSVIHIRNGALACYLTLKTEIKTDWGMFWEIITPEMLREITERRKDGIYISKDPTFKKLLIGHEESRKRLKVIAKIGPYKIGEVK